MEIGNRNKLMRRVIGILLCIFMLCGCGSDGKTSQVTDLGSFQRLSFDATEDYKAAMEKLDEGCDPARIIRDDETVSEDKLVLVLQGISDRVTVEKALEMLEKHEMKAAFAVTAMEAAEDDELLKLIQDKGHEIIDNGPNGESELELCDDEELVKSFTSSRKVFETLLNFPPKYGMFNSTYYNDAVCMAATASGYEKLVAPAAGRYLNAYSFDSEELAQEYVGRMKTGTILVYRLRGYVDAAEYEPKEEHKDPAKDFQATVVIGEEEEESEEEEDADTLRTLGWLLDSLDHSGYETVSLSSLKAMTTSEYVASLFENKALLKADCYAGVSTMEMVTGLTFYGLPAEKESAKKIAQLLLDENAGATVFVSAEELKAGTECAEILKEAGCSFATLGEDGSDLNGREPLEIYTDLSSGRREIQRKLSLRCKYYLSKEKPDDNVLKAAGVSGMTVIRPEEILTAEELKAEKDPKEMPETAEAGMIRCFALSQDFPVSALENYLKDAKQKGLTVLDVSDLLKTEDSIPEIPEETLKELREANAGKLAEQRTFIYTSDRTMALLFSGITNEAVLTDVLNILEKKGYMGTFYATLDEMRAYPELIRRILEGGHELGLSYRVSPRVPAEFMSVAQYILQANIYCEWKYDTTLRSVFQPFGERAEEMLEAVSATGLSFAAYEYTMVQSKDEEAVKVSDFYPSYSSKVTIHRGSVTYFRMDFYQADRELDPEETEETLLGNLLKTYLSDKVDSLTWRDAYGVAQADTSYQIIPYSELISSANVYKPGGVSGRIVMNNHYVEKLGDASLQNDYMAARYIGNPDVSVIPGLEGEELAKFDTTGRLTDQKVLFLTFDDWGNDKEVNGLLYVLKKHNVKASFFVKTQNVENNPNLLRAIAADGHMIGSHSDTHFVGWHVTQKDDGNYVYESLTDQEALTLRTDVVRSYQTLERYVGDMKINGRAALTTFYRPPHLAVSRNAMYQIFDAGFSYIVSGELRTTDYSCKSVDELLDILTNGRKTWNGRIPVTDGSILVMHFSPTSVYTADALDRMIPVWKEQGYSFARLDDYIQGN